MSLFAGLALLLATVGVFGLIAYFVSRHLKEIGIRMALGATRSHIARMVLLRGMSPVVAGIALGGCAALALTRALSSRMPELGAGDPSTFLIAGGVFLLASALACLVPRWTLPSPCGSVSFVLRS